MTKIKLTIFSFSILLAILLGIVRAQLKIYEDEDTELTQANLERLIRLLELGNHLLENEEADPYILSTNERLARLIKLKLIEKLRENQVENFPSSQGQDYFNEELRDVPLPYSEYETGPRSLDYPEIPYVDLARIKQIQNERQLREYLYRHFNNNKNEKNSNINNNNNNKKQEDAFVYAFKKPNLSEKNPIAVAPNDPRYYGPDDRGFDDPIYRSRIFQETSPHQSYAGNFGDDSPESPQRSGLAFHPQAENTVSKQEEIAQKLKVPITKVVETAVFSKTNLDETNILPEPQRRAEQGPLVVSIGSKFDNDVYFVAFVAGCSAVAMFCLVMISLTCFRMHRVSKAAANVEYPAYGVVGPNKDISPSGDQRLAQSAQMYHFQHQKQQIIAMEKASAARDPGSVSDAESDEENEEGDYTVYECPGLAPTGEMEVKNPLFHDDPTPSMPANNKNEKDL